MKLNKMASRREFLEQMSTQELDRMLQSELQKETIDDDLVRQILDILEFREMDYPVEYNQEIVEPSQKLEDISRSTSRKVKNPRILKVASVLLVVGILLFALPNAVHAENFFELLARWTDSVFEFFNPAEPNDQPEYVFRTDNPGLQQVYDTIVELGVTDPVVPMWVPEGFVLEELKVTKDPGELWLYANMKCEDREICISVITQIGRPLLSHMKDTEDVKIFETNGIEHYIISNHGLVNASWIINNVECSIVTDCREDTYRILKSIYTTEDS